MDGVSLITLSPTCLHLFQIYNYPNIYVDEFLSFLFFLTIYTDIGI